MEVGHTRPLFLRAFRMHILARIALLSSFGVFMGGRDYAAGRVDRDCFFEKGR